MSFTYGLVSPFDSAQGDCFHHSPSKDVRLSGVEASGKSLTKRQCFINTKSPKQTAAQSKDSAE